MPQYIIKTLSFIFAMLMGWGSVWAIPAKPCFRYVEQPDGSMILIRIEGDERGRLMFGEDGELLKLNERGFYVKSGAQSSEIRSKIAKRQLKNSESVSRKDRVGLMSKTNFPTLGEHKGLVILVEFPNKAFSKAEPAEYVARLLNDDDFTEYGAEGSVAAYYESNSRGLFRPLFDVVGPVMLPQTYQYYGENVMKHDDIVGDYIDDAHPADMVVDACEILSREGFDFSVYDCNGDGEIDNVFLFYAGFGEADGGSPMTVWPHSNNLREIGYSETPIMFDGVELNHYACTNELKSDTGEHVGIGTFIHEFTHVMGFPDIYPLTGASVVTPDYWDVMDLGCYLNGGHTPPNYSAFELYAFGWLDPEELTSEGAKGLSNLHSSDGNALVVYRSDREEKSDEFFILENRQQKGRDKFLPGHGMLVWHIDFDQAAWDANLINAEEDHPRVRIIEADNMPGHYEILEEPGRLPQLVFNYENDGDPYPGTSGNTSLTFNSTPSFCDWDGKPLDWGFTDIREDKDGYISFNVISTSGTNSPVLGICEYEVYDLMGRKVGKIGESPLNLPKGVYVAKGDKSYKFTIR